MKKILLIALIFSVSLPLLKAETDNRYYISTSKAMSLSMGGAYNCVTDYSESMQWNPAGIKIPAGNRPNRLYLNSFATPFIAAGIILINPYDDDDEEEITASAEFGLKILAYSMPFFAKSGLLIPVNNHNCVFAWNLVEDVFPYDTFHYCGKDSNKDENIFDGSSYSLAFKYSISAGFSIGANTTLYDLMENDQRKTCGGYTLGTMFYPSDGFSLGLTYYGAGPNARNALSPVERIIDNSANLGLLFSRINNIEITCDIRNLFNSDEDAFRELHLGAEGRFAKWFALRGGYYREHDTDKSVYSLGFNLMRLNYGFVKKSGEDTRYHLISFMIPLRF